MQPQYIPTAYNTKDITGQRFGRLVVLFCSGRCAAGQLLWHCCCDCGNTTTVYGTNLRKGSTQSCGCLRKEAPRTHGMSGTSIYRIWHAMIKRCTNRNDSNYRDYGGRGITVCDQWRNSFETFYADMGEPPTAKLTLERIDNDQGYRPDNCRWATRLEQGRNTRRNRLISFDGETLTLQEWAERIGLNKSSLRDRLDKMHWSIERALTTPARTK